MRYNTDYEFNINTLRLASFQNRACFYKQVALMELYD